MAVDDRSGGATGAGVPSEDELETVIAELFAEEFELPRVDVEEHFLFLGGDSMNAETLVRTIADRFGIRLQTATLLEAPTPRSLAKVVAAKLRKQAGQS
jgi:acyl carrier protein